MFESTTCTDLSESFQSGVRKQRSPASIVSRGSKEKLKLVDVEDCPSKVLVAGWEEKGYTIRFNTSMSKQSTSKARLPEGNGEYPCPHSSKAGKTESYESELKLFLQLQQTLFDSEDLGIASDNAGDVDSKLDSNASRTRSSVSFSPYSADTREKRNSTGSKTAQPCLRRASNAAFWNDSCSRRAKSEEVETPKPKPPASLARDVASRSLRSDNPEDLQLLQQSALQLRKDRSPEPSVFHELTPSGPMGRQPRGSGQVRRGWSRGSWEGTRAAS